MTGFLTASLPDELRLRAEAAHAEPHNPQRRAALAIALAKSGQPRAALEEYRAVLTLRPNDPDVAADAGLMARRCGLEEEVLPLVRSAAHAHPGHAKVWQVLGLLHRALDELEPAASALARAASLAPSDPLVMHGHARATFDAGRPASDLFRRALSLAPSNDEVRLGLAAALIAEGRWRDAMAELEARVARDPDWVPGHAAIARLRWQMGQKDRFTESLETALASSPRNLGLWRELILVLMHAGHYEPALDVIARGRAALGPEPAFTANEAVCRAELGQFAEADRLFALVAHRNDESVAVRLVRHLLRSGRPDQALAAAEPWLATPLAFIFWPYVSIAWRQLADPRWEWLEGEPALVGIYDLASSLPPLNTLANTLRGLHNTIGHPLDQSVRGGTQTDGQLFQRVEPEIRALRAAVVEAVQAHVAALPHRANHPQLGFGPVRSPVRFSGSWSVRLTDSGHHSNHVHPAGWFSSALYIALPEPAARGSEPAGWLTLGEPQAELDLDLPPFRLIEPKPGRLALFPSTMWHGTRPFAVGERLTVAFDVATPRGA